MKKIIKTNNAPQSKTYSQAIIFEKLVYVSGQVPFLAETNTLIKGGIKEQTNQALKNLVSILEEAGSNIENVLKVEIFMKNISDYDLINEVYLSFFKSHKPARQAVEVSNLPFGVLVEISCIAHL